MALKKLSGSQLKKALVSAGIIGAFVVVVWQQDAVVAKISDWNFSEGSELTVIDLTEKDSLLPKPLAVTENDHSFIEAPALPPIQEVEPVLTPEPAPVDLVVLADDVASHEVVVIVSDEDDDIVAPVEADSPEEVPSILTQVAAAIGLGESVAPEVEEAPLVLEYSGNYDGLLATLRVIRPAVAADYDALMRIYRDAGEDGEPQEFVEDWSEGVSWDEVSEGLNKPYTSRRSWFSRSRANYTDVTPAMTFFEKTGVELSSENRGCRASRNLQMLIAGSSVALQALKHDLEYARMHSVPAE